MDSYYKWMVVRLRSRLSWVFCIVGIIAMGILSRVVHTGFAVFDKYLGDALYAADGLCDLAPVIEGCGVGRVRDGCNDRYRVVSTDNDSGPHAGE